MMRAVTGVLLAFVSIAPLLAAPDQAAGPLTRVVYATVTDRNGQHVEGLTAADFAVKEGGKSRDVVEAGLSTSPLRIMLLIDDNGTGIFRAGVARFIQRLQGRAVFALSTVTGQQLKLLDYTADADRLVEAINQLSARPATSDGGQLLDSIFETAKDQGRRRAERPERPIIVALTVGGEEHTPLPAHHVLNELAKSGSALHVISVTAGSLRQSVDVSRASGLLGENMNLNEVLGDGPRQSGGTRSEIVAAAGTVSGLQQLAELLLHQYVVAYNLPSGVKPNERVAVSVKRPDLSVRAPTRVPTR